jgi:membrane protein YdbS with pleckstrin-like domain
MFILEEGENIVKVVRKHWFVMLATVLGILFMATIPALIYILLVSKYVNIGIWAGFLYSLWLLILWVIFFIDWTDYYLDMLLITDKRVLNINQNGFFRREIISFRYEQIQDITVETRGVIQTFFKFGLIQIQTAGEKRCIILKHADNPESVRSEILKRQALVKPNI